jgi:hypothetical protein
MDHDPITEADVQRFLEQGAQHVCPTPTPQPAPPCPARLLLAEIAAEAVYEQGQPVLVCSASHYDHHERVTGETLSNLT